MMQAYRKLIVATPGTPIRVTSIESDPALALKCHAVLIQALPTNTGKVYVGDVTLNAAGLTGLLGVLAIPTANNIPTFSAALTYSPNAINLQDIYVDADVGGEGATISLLVT